MSNDADNYPEDSFDNMIKFAKNIIFHFPYVIDEDHQLQTHIMRYALQIFLVIIIILNSSIEVELESLTI